MTRVTRIFVVATAFLAAPPAIVAQSEKVSIRMAPRPGQTVRMTSAQEADIDISIDGAAAAPGVMAMKMAMRTMAVMTQKTGAVKPDGTLDAPPPDRARRHSTGTSAARVRMSSTSTRAFSDRTP